MTKNTYLYTYHVAFQEWSNVTKEEMLKLVQQESQRAKSENFALIATGKNDIKQGFFDAFSAPKLTKDFIWLYVCPESLLGDDQDDIEEKFYVFSFCAHANDGIHI